MFYKERSIHYNWATLILQNLTYYGYYVVHAITCYLILKTFGVLWGIIALISIFPFVLPEIVMFVTAKINHNAFYLILICSYVVIFIADFINRNYMVKKEEEDVDYLHWFNNYHWHTHVKH